MHSGTSSDEKGEASPAPLAVNVDEPCLPHPFELWLDWCEDVFGIIVGSTDSAVELRVQLGGGTSDDLEIDEHPLRVQDVGDLSEQFTFPVILDVMDCEARDDSVERAERSQRVVEIMTQNRRLRV